MKCKKCGGVLKGGEKFCITCGMPIEKHRKNIKSVIGFTVGILLCVALLVGIVAVTQMSDESLKANLDLAYKYLNEGLYEEAIIEFNKVLEIDPKNTRAIIGTADAYIGLEQFDFAVSFMEEHIADDAKNTDLYDKLIDIYVDVEDYENATRIMNIAEKNGYRHNRKEELSKIGSNNEFNSGHNVVHSNEKTVWIDSEGVYMMNSDGVVKKVNSIVGLASAFATNGKLAYFHDNNNKCIYEVNLDTGEDRVVAQTYTSAPDDAEPGFSGGVMACVGNYLYVQEWYGVDYCQDYKLNIKTGEYVQYNTSAGYIGDIESYKDRIYYSELRMDLYAVTVFEAATDGRDEKVFKENVLSFRIIGDKFYYQEEDRSASESIVKCYDFITGEETVLGKVPYQEEVQFNEVGYGYYENICFYSGETANTDEFISDCNDNYFITRGWDGSQTLIFQNKNGDIVKKNIDGDKIPAGYYDEKLYYIEMADDYIQYQIRYVNI